MIHGGVVPKDFKNGIIIPIPKVKHISKCPKSEDFRGITLNTVLSKIFELCLFKFFSSIPLSDRQFGFRKNRGCLDAIHMVQKTIRYFNKRGSTINIGVIDLRKAFDKINHFGILLMMQKQGIPVEIINVFEFWFANIHSKVKWVNCFSNDRKLNSGVRQGASCLQFSSLCMLMGF